MLPFRLLRAAAVIGTLVYLSPTRQEAGGAPPPSLTQGRDAVRSLESSGTPHHLLKAWNGLPPEAQQTLARVIARSVQENGQEGVPSPPPAARERPR